MTTVSREGPGDDARRSTSDDQANLIGMSNRGGGEADFTTLMSSRGKFPHVRLFLVRSDSGRESVKNYNACTTFSGKLIYVIRIDRTLGAIVNVKIGGTPREFNIAPMITRAADKWRTLLAETPLSIEKLNADEDDEEEIEPNLLILTEKNVPLERGVAFTQPMQSYYQNQEFPSYSVMKFNENFEIKKTAYDDLKSYAGSENSDDLLDMFYYAAALHEFGHVLGLAHPQDEKGVKKSDPIPIIRRDSPALMNADVMEFLDAVYRGNGHKPFTIDMISPSSGEIEELQKSMRHATEPS